MRARVSFGVLRRSPRSLLRFTCYYGPRSAIESRNSLPPLSLRREQTFGETFLDGGWVTTFGGGERKEESASATESSLFRRSLVQQWKRPLPARGTADRSLRGAQGELKPSSSLTVTPKQELRLKSRPT